MIVNFYQCNGDFTNYVSLYQYSAYYCKSSCYLTCIVPPKYSNITGTLVRTTEHYNIGKISTSRFVRVHTTTSTIVLKTRLSKYFQIVYVNTCDGLWTTNVIYWQWRRNNMICKIVTKPHMRIFYSITNLSESVQESLHKVFFRKKWSPYCWGTYNNRDF